MPNGIFRSGGQPAGRPPVFRPPVFRRRSFPRFFFFPLLNIFPPGCYYIDRYGRCCDRYGRCCDMYGRCDYGYDGYYPFISDT